MVRKPKPSGRERKEDLKDSATTILIVCEGEKTEVGYFKGLIDKLEIKKTTRIRVEGHGETPLTVVDRAINEKRNNIHGIEYDETWCVFDRDQHPKVPEARKKAKDNGLKVAYSCPCFEFWYLLHFEQTTKPHNKCAGVIRLLKKDYIQDYGKGKCCIDLLFPHTQTAIKNASYVRKHECDEPSTDVDKLVVMLLEEKKKRS